MAQPLLFIVAIVTCGWSQIQRKARLRFEHGADPLRPHHKISKASLASTALSTVPLH
jgi:hypothetical protein